RQRAGGVLCSSPRRLVTADTTRRERCAEGVGFEPTEACASQLFKSCAFVRSAIPPGRKAGLAAHGRWATRSSRDEQQRRRADGTYEGVRTHSASSTTIPGPLRNTSRRSWKSMTALRGVTPCAARWA